MITPVRPHSSALRWPLAMLAALAMTLPAQAVGLSYSFAGVTGAGTLLDFGGGPVAATGVAFTVVGSTSDIDLSSVGDGFGLFAATSTYSFAGFGTFTTDAGTDRYFQNCYGPGAITCVGLFDPAGSAGFLLGFTPIAGDPDSGMVIGTPSGAFLVGSTAHYLANAAGQQIYWNAGAFSDMSIQAVPEPGMFFMFGLGLAALAVRRRARA